MQTEGPNGARKGLKEGRIGPKSMNRKRQKILKETFARELEGEAQRQKAKRVGTETCDEGNRNPKHVDVNGGNSKPRECEESTEESAAE